MINCVVKASERDGAAQRSIRADRLHTRSAKGGARWLPMVAAFLLVAGSSLHAFASEMPKYPAGALGTRLINPSSRGYDHVEVRCEPTSTVAIKCAFTQILITKEIWPEDVEAKVEEEWNQFNTDWNKLSVEEQKEQIATPPFECSSEEKLKEELRRIAQLRSKSQAEYKATLQGLQVFLEWCQVKTVDDIPKSMRTLIRAMKEEESKSCNVVSTSWVEIFKFDRRSGKWTSQSGPQGLCSATIISTLYQDKEPPIPTIPNWIYETRKIYHNKKGPCAGWDETPSKYISPTSAKFFSPKFNLRRSRYMNCVFIEP